MKHEKLLERVYNPGQLHATWQQVKENAGAAGTDKMTAEEFERRKDELLKRIHEKLKAFLCGMLHMLKPMINGKKGRR